MRYKYLAATASGLLAAGTLDASEETAAEKALAQAGYRLLTLQAIKPPPSLETLFPSLFGVKSAEVISLSRQLATLLASGIDVVTAVDILGEQAPAGPLKRMLREIAENLRGGSSLGAALARYPAVFSPTFRRMVEMGEQTGAPEEALEQAAANMERQRQATRKVMQAMLYPSMVIGMAVLVAIVLVVVVLPPLTRMFTSLGAQLPLPTRMLIALTSFLHAHFLELMALGGAGVVGLFLCLRTPGGRRRRDQLMLRLPLLGRILLYHELSRFARTVSTLLQAGLTMSESIKLATGSCSNRRVRQALESATAELLQGGGLSGPLSRTKLFPSMMVQMVRVGEETGRLDANLAVLAGAYETEAAEKTQALIATLEPLMTVAVAVLVGFIALSVILPMYTMMGSIK